MNKELQPCSGGDAAVCAATIIAFYEKVDNSPDGEIPAELTLTGMGEEYRATSVGGPSGEIVFHVFNDEGEMVAWVDTGYIN